jgi:hypothetical protein
MARTCGTAREFEKPLDIVVGIKDIRPSTSSWYQSGGQEVNAPLVHVAGQVRQLVRSTRLS